MDSAQLADNVGRAIRVTADALRPWIEERLDTWPSDGHGRVAPEDPAYLVGVLLTNWRTVFASPLGSEGLTLGQDLRHTRNRWAHHVPFDRFDAIRAIDTCRQLTEAVGSERHLELEGLLRTVLAASPDQPVAEPPPTRLPPARRVSAGTVGTHRRMADESYRSEQWGHRFDEHIGPINRLVDDLIDTGRRWMPYVAPYHGGTKATILLLFQDPGPMTAIANGGSGFIGCENDDPSANLLADCLDAAGLAQSDVTPWNAYPWYLGDGGSITSARLAEGLDPLRQLLALLPSAHTVLTGGKKAQQSWKMFSARFPAAANRLRPLATFHTSGRGITNGGQQTAAVGTAHVIDTLKRARSTAP